MKFLISVVVGALCLNCSFSVENTYKAAVVPESASINVAEYSRVIHEAAKTAADILVLPSASTLDHYDEIINSLSDAAKASKMYVVAPLVEKIRCQGKSELIRSNLVFDREGNVVSTYKKPVNIATNCTEFSTAFETFTTDFGVTFAVYMEEDLVLQRLDAVKGLQNFVVTGGWPLQMPLLSATQFASSWAYTANANLITSAGIFAGRAGVTGSGAKVVVADLQKDGGSDHPLTPPATSEKRSLVEEDWSHYIIKPLDLDASLRGYKETVCHREFCCEFDVKISFVGKEVSYGLAAFSGVRHLAGGRHVGAASCALAACAGLYKRSCELGHENNSTKAHFERITITGNFTGDNVQFPISTTIDNSPVTFKFDSTTLKDTEKVTIEVKDVQNLMNFGIFGRDFAKDYETEYVYEEKAPEDLYEYIFNDDMQEFFDYLWIRVRILFVVVSIYVLEML